MANDRSLPPHEDDFTRALLRSADADEPSSVAYAKVAGALGVGAAVGVGASVPVPAAVGGASWLSRWSGSLTAKLALVGVSGALLVGVAGAFLHHRLVPGAMPPHAARVAAASVPSTPPLRVAPAQSIAATGAALAVHGAGMAPAVNGAGNASALPAGAATPPAHIAPRAARVAPQVARSSSLPEQVQSLDRARVALSSGDAGAALTEIAHYRQVWPNGVFLTEASVLEVEALAKRGERGLASERAKAFVEAHPDSPQADRLRALIPTDQP